MGSWYLVYGAFYKEEVGSKALPSWYVHLLKIQGVESSYMAIKKRFTGGNMAAFAFWFWFVVASWFVFFLLVLSFNKVPRFSHLDLKR
jgi:hypothetical protein